MNNSENTTVNWTTYSVERRVTLAFFVLTFVFGSIGSILVLLVVAKKSSRTTNDVFIMHLAISDLCFLLFCLPVFIYMQVSDFRGSLEYCKFIWPMMTVSFCAGIFTVAVMAVHRCQVILHPFQGTLYKRQLMYCFLIIWLLSLLVALPLMIVAKVGPSGDCYEDWRTHDHKRAYTAVLAALQYMIPLVIIAVAYVRIGVELFNSKRRSSFISSRHQADEARKQENIKVVKVLATIVVSFAVFMLPNHLAWILIDFGGVRGEKVALVIFKFSDILAVFHSCLNPIIYGTVTRRFRHEYVKYLSACLCCLGFESVERLCNRGCCVPVVQYRRYHVGDTYNSQNQAQTLLRMDGLAPSQSMRYS